MKKIFLTAAWSRLIMANYEIDPGMLLPYLPAHTQLDYFNDKCYVSLVGFLFEKVRIKGIRIPFHTAFPEVNLRFYVRHMAEDGKVKRGVVFISEVVPKRAIAWVANNIYRENYVATAMNHSVTAEGKDLLLKYGWYWEKRNNHIAARVVNQLGPIEPGTKEAFIFENYYGYAKVNASVTNQYTVEHPAWNIYPVRSYEINCDFENFYGNRFSFLDQAAPASVFVAEGSAVVIREKVILKG